MKRHIIWSSDARQELEKIAIYISRNSPAAALRLVAAMEQAIQQLTEAPELGSTWESTDPSIGDLRYWPVRHFKNYLIFYRVGQEAIEILHVLHAARDIDRLLGA